MGITIKRSISSSFQPTILAENHVEHQVEDVFYGLLALQCGYDKKIKGSHAFIDDLREYNIG